MAEEKQMSGLRTFAYLIGFGFILTTIFVVAGIKRYNENLFDVGYQVNIQKINEALLLMTASGTDYFYSPMYIDEGENINYEETAGTFIKSYFDLKKYCGTTPGECFASKYKNEKKKPYKPAFKGACGQLKSGTSFCIIPQIANADITGLMDMNGPYGPNVLGKDLREYTIKARKTYIRKNVPVSEVIEADVPTR